MSDEWEALPSGDTWEARASGATWSSRDSELAPWEARTPEEGGEATPPVAITAPSIAGVFDWDSVLTVTPGAYTGADTVTGQWQRLDPSAPTWSDIAGETALTYTIDDALDYPGGLRYEETAANATGSVSQVSNALSSPWAALISEVPSLVVARRSRLQVAGGAGTLAEWGYHNDPGGQESLVTSLAPLLDDGRANLDGVDDRLIDKDEATRAALGQGAHTILVAVHELGTTANTVRTIVSAASTSSGINSNQVRLRLGGNSGSGRWQYYVSGSGSVALDLSGLLATYGTGPYVVAARCTGAGGALSVVDLIPATPVVVASGAAPATLPTGLNLLTVGLQRYGVGLETAPSRATIGLLLLAPVALTDAQLALARSILVTEGYL